MIVVVGGNMNIVHCFVVGAVAVLTIIVAVCGFQPQSSGFASSDFLRIHIRANSNSECDQLVKYEVKAEVVEALTPLLAQATTKAQAMDVVRDNLALIKSVADRVLEREGFGYKAAAHVCVEEFPTRQYEDLVLESGFYDALILNLGTGEGNNWWCVVYPPMCFVGGADDGGDNLHYKSKLAEVVNNFFK